MDEDDFNHFYTDNKPLIPKKLNCYVLSSVQNNVIKVEKIFTKIIDVEWVDREVDLVVRKETRKSLTEIEIATVNENVPKIESAPDRLDVIGKCLLLSTSWGRSRITEFC